MKFLRTASTRRLLTVLVGAIAVVIAGAAIAVAASGSGPVPKGQPLANAVHQALSASAPQGISADVSFTNNLIDSSDFTGEAKDPILQGATGRLWLSKDQLRLELQSDNGDAQVLVNKNAFWISDPASHTLYEGTLPADKSDKSDKADTGVPTVAQIQTRLNRLMQSVDTSGAQPTDVAGQAAYRVSISPKHSAGLLGSAQLAWDAVRGVPLEIGIYARGNTTPVLDLKATNISYGAVAPSVFAINPPSGEKVVKLSDTNRGRRVNSAAHTAKAGHAKVSGVQAVAGRVPFTLTAPASLVGLPRRDASLLNEGGKPAALITYGQNLGGMAVIEQSAKTGKQAGSQTATGSRDGLSLPTVSINGATGQELSTALGTVLTFTSGKVAYTVIGSVPAAAAEQAARALTAP
jgi:hypothetical protein